MINKKLLDFFTRFKGVLFAVRFIIVVLLIIGGCQAVYSYFNSSELDFEKILHVALPITVLAMEVYMIKKMTDESFERAETVHHFKELAVQTRRNQYLAAIANSISSTKKEAIFTTASMEVSANSSSQKAILEAVISRQAKGSYMHRGLVAKRLEALPGAVELTIKTNVTLRISEAVALSRLRFFVNDAEHCILGVAEGQPSLALESKKTTQSTFLSSRTLGNALYNQFNLLWSSSIEVGEYLDSLIDSSSPPVQRVTVEEWFSSVNVEKKTLIAYLEKISLKYKALEVTPEADA